MGLGIPRPGNPGKSVVQVDSGANRHITEEE